MRLHKVRGAADPTATAHFGKHASDLVKQLRMRQNSNRGLHAKTTENGKLVGVFFDVGVIGHSRAFLPRVHHINTDFGKIVGDLTYNVAAGTSEVQAMDTVKAGIDGYYY